MFSFIKKIDKNFFLCVSLITVMLLSAILPIGAFRVSAQSKPYSDVLYDLKQDQNFDVNNYPDNPNDYSLKIISIAESKDKELFIYVYQPSDATKELTASHINISQTINESAKYVHYSLKLLSSEGVFDKYIVEGLTVKDDVQRYYDCPSIFRAWDSTIDAGSSNENDINYVVYEVGKLFTATTLEGVTYYTETYSETVEITDKRVGYMLYNEGYKWTHLQQCAAHYVAFNSDHQIDTLYEADLTYKLDKYTRTTITNLTGVTEQEKREPVINEQTGTNDYYVTLSSMDTVSTNPGLFGTKYSWTRIQSAEEFIKTENLTDDAKEKLSGYSWILRFCETEINTSVYTSGESAGTTTTQITWYNNVSEVTILRLMFETNGQLYNLGVVDNVQTAGNGQGSDNNPDFEPSCGYIGPSFWQWLLWGLAGAVILYIIVLYFPYIVKAIPYVFRALKFVIKYIAVVSWYVIKYLSIGLYYVIVSPYYLVRWIKERRE